MKMEFSKNNDLLTLLAALSSLFRVPIRSPSAATGGFSLCLHYGKGDCGAKLRPQSETQRLTTKIIVHC
jgi:hypothetical protein